MNRIEVKIEEHVTLSSEDKKEVLKLWNDEYPEELFYRTIPEFDAYLDNLKEQKHFILRDDRKRIIGWYFRFNREGEVWFALIIGSRYHGQQLGTKLLQAVKENEPVLNGWVVVDKNLKKNNGEIYESPLGFYLQNGFKINDQDELKLGAIKAKKIVWKK